MTRDECIYCGATEFRWVAGSGNLEGYDVLACAHCGEPVTDDGSTETRKWVGR
jgi:hypothetical protein